MKTKKTLIALILAAAAALLLPGFSRADGLTVSVDSPASVSQGDSFAVDVNIADAIDIYDFQLDLTFDPSILQASDVLEGTFLSGGGSTFFFPGFIDNSAGDITFNADTLVGAIPGVDGGGVLLQFDFDALAPGTSSLDIQSLILQDSLGNLIDGTVANGSVTVASGETVPSPEPGALTMLIAGLAVLTLSGFGRCAFARCR
jgi:Cohesin domain